MLNGCNGQLRVIVATWMISKGQQCREKLSKGAVPEDASEAAVEFVLDRTDVSAQVVSLDDMLRRCLASVRHRRPTTALDELITLEPSVPEADGHPREVHFPEPMVVPA
jgi:hypothetical protein